MLVSFMLIISSEIIYAQLYPEPIHVDGGKFQMGDNAGDKDERPAHQVTVKSFSIAKTETTVGQWQEFCTSTSRKMPEVPWFGLKVDQPIVNVSWDNATAYCLWLTNKTGKKYRLPTEAEWEFAARGGNKSTGSQFSGNKIIDSVAWYGGKSVGPMPVAQKLPNELGIYDMTGNVWEWCSDWYDANYYASSPAIDPKGPASGKYYTFRGGAWDIGARNGRVSYRNPLSPTSRNHNKGFRVVLEE